MAWYAELKRRKWYCINGVNMIQLYRKKRYDDWYNSLTDEQKQRLEEYRKEQEEKRMREAKMALARLLAINTILNRHTHDTALSYGELMDDFFRK